MHLGIEQTRLINWLTIDWFKDGEFKICFIQGFPGTGKTSIASEVLEVAKQQHDFIAVRTTVIDNDHFSSDDFFFQLAQDLSIAGITALEESINEHGSSRIQNAIKQILSDQKVCIIIDEAQWAMSETGVPDIKLQRLFEDISTLPLKGRVLVLTNQDVDKGKWADRVSIKEYRGLNEEEALTVLDKLINDEVVLLDEVVKSRLDIVKTLGCNPRALGIFISRLKNESLEALIGKNPNLWETSDRKFSPDLLRRLEREIIQAGFARLNERELQLLQWLSLLRLPFQHDAIIRFTDDNHLEADKFRQKLKHLYFIEHQHSSYRLHPIVKEIARQKLIERNSSFVKAHKKAATYYTRHFQHSTSKIPLKLGGNFIEARYHLTNGKDFESLRKVINRFGDFIHASITSGTPVPSISQEINERIAMLKAYLVEGVGGYGIEYHLAQCLRKRGDVQDVALALTHALNAIRENTTGDSLFLAAELYVANNEAGAAINLLRNGIAQIPATDKAFSLYIFAASLMAENKDTPRAIELLKEGILKIPPEKSLASLYVSCAELMLRNTDDKTGAIDLLKNGIIRIPREFSQVSIINKLINVYYRYNDLSSLISLKNSELPLLQDKLCQILIAFGECDYYRGAEIAKHFIEDVFDLGMFNQYIFGLLCCRNYDEAFAEFKKHEFSYSSNITEAGIWLYTFTALKSGHTDDAKHWYQKLNLDDVQVVNEKVLVEYWWNSKNKYGFTPIIAFPQLPCGITGLDITLSIYGNGIEDNIARIGIKEQQKVDFDIPAKTKVLCIATEWLSRNGGLSTFNRFLCRTLSSENCEVVCVVLDSDITEKQSAIDDGVILIDAQKGPAASNINPLQSRLDLPKGFIPDIIIGHDRITGESMLDQKRSFFESAKTILFIHTAPEEIELLKDSHEGIELMKRAEQRRQLQKDIALKSDLVAAVGPHLYTEIYMQLGATEGARKVIRFDPGLMSSDPVATDIKLPTPLCQIFGRMEDDALKGVDIAIKVMDKVYSKATTPVKPVLIIRGLVEGTGDSFMRKKNQLSTSGLPIRYRVYDPSIETLTDDLRASSLILMPSRAEGFGLTGLEAISAGCPALLSDRSGLAELILEFAPEEAHHWIVSVAGDETTFLGKWETQVEFILSDRKAARERLKTLRDKLSEKISWTASVKAMMDALNEKQNLTLSPSLASRECELS